jgi:hypothetical protein
MKFFKCVCGEPWLPRVIHRKDKPCYEIQETKWGHIKEEEEEDPPPPEEKDHA